MARKTNNVQIRQTFTQMITGTDGSLQLFRRREWKSRKGDHWFLEITVSKERERLRMGVISHGRETVEIDSGQSFLNL